MAIGDTYELTQRSITTTGTVQCLNVFHFKDKTGGLTPGNLCSDWATNVIPSWRAATSNLLTITQVDVKSMMVGGLLPSTVYVGLNGTRVTGMIPPLCACVISWRTDRPGRRYRGRSYISGLGQADAADGKLSTTVINLMVTLATAIYNRYGLTGTSTQAQIGVWSRVIAGPNPPYDPLAFEPISTWLVRSAAGSMGTRRFGRGI